jgi:3,2-trans-enoyl-CoA isomerase
MEESVSEFERVVQIEHGPVRELRMNRPPVNALTGEFLDAIRAGIEGAQHQGVKAVVLSGSPGRFSAGLDLPALIPLDREGIAATWRALYELLHAIAASPIPVVAAITGHAVAGGILLTLFCDWRVAAAGDYKLGLKAVHVGIPVTPIIMAGLRRQLGLRAAEYLAVTGPLLSPQQALQFGLVDELAEPGSVIERAVEWCQGFAVIPAAVNLTRNRARADLVAFFEDERLEEDRFTESWFSPSTQKQIRAVVERLGKSGAKRS